MPRRWVRTVVVVLGVVVVLWVVGSWLFDLGGSVPGSGTGDVVTEPSP